MTFNIYVPSYHRSDAIMTAKLLEYCTYVVRESEKELYLAAGVESVLAVPDEKIDSCEKVHNWIIDNVPEDVVAVLDDDLKSVSFRLDNMYKLTDKQTITQEIERIAQLVSDMSIGYGASPSDMSVMYYDRPFKFVGVTSGLKFYNRKKLKARVPAGLRFLSDMDFELTELIANRVILIPNYFCTEFCLDTNKGGNNDTKSLDMFAAENEVMKNKWGKYYIKADGGKAGKLNVDR